MNGNLTGKRNRVSGEQILFLDDAIREAADKKTVFVFFHELLWNGGSERYRDVMANSRSRYSSLTGISNYWSEIHPVFLKYPDKKFYLFAGDMAGNPDAASVFYDNVGNVTLAASGMGEVPGENYLTVTVENDHVSIRVNPLRENQSPYPLEEKAHRIADDP